MFLDTLVMFKIIILSLFPIQEWKYLYVIIIPREVSELGKAYLLIPQSSKIFSSCWMKIMKYAETAWDKIFDIFSPWTFRWRLIQEDSVTSDVTRNIFRASYLVVQYQKLEFLVFLEVYQYNFSESNVWSFLKCLRIEISDGWG